MILHYTNKENPMCPTEIRNKCETDFSCLILIFVIATDTAAQMRSVNSSKQESARLSRMQDTNRYKQV